MLSTHYTKEILGSQGVIVKSTETTGENTEIAIEMERRECVCPFCGRKTDRIHDYRTQIIRDLPAFGKNVVLKLRKRRYSCSCGKHFYESIPFLPRYGRMRQRKTLNIIDKLFDIRSYTPVAEEHNVSVSTVIRLFNNIRYPKPEKLPNAIGIDEFKGNSGKQKYHCILTDLETGKVIDIIRTRYQHDLIDYFKRYDRSGVKYFVSDRYSTYAEIASTDFPKATYVTDRYHWIRQAIWAFEAVRKEEQNHFSKTHRIYFKHSKNLLLKRERLLTDDEKQQVNSMLYASPNLSTAYFLKEELYRVLDEKVPDRQRQLFDDWISDSEDCGVSAFEKCAGTYRRWRTPILNSFGCRYSNGFTEGCNNKIKVLKRNAYGFQNFRRFRNRILYLFSHPARRAQ